MKLQDKDVAFYHDNGYLMINDYFTDKEIEILSSELPNTIEKDSPRVILEDNGSVRSVFAPHFSSEVYKQLSRLERFIIPSEQLVKDKVYLHQYKINTKKGLKGDWWEWHQDFPYWHYDDGIEKPEMVSVMLYLQDTDSLNGALLLIPKTHKMGIVNFQEKDPDSFKQKEKYNDHLKTKDYLSSLNSNIKFTVRHDHLKSLAEKNTIVTAAGKKGTVVFFHGNIFHASNTNLTPFDRDVIILTYNSINNLPKNTANPRPEFLVGRDYNPIDGLVKTI